MVNPLLLFLVISFVLFLIVDELIAIYSSGIEEKKDGIDSRTKNKLPRTDEAEEKL